MFQYLHFASEHVSSEKAALHSNLFL